MDTLDFVTVWNRNGLSDAKVTMKWTGLQIEGATFDGSRLLKNNSNSPSIGAAPLCTVAWMPQVRSNIIF